VSSSNGSAKRHSAVAFLLAQLGAAAADGFAARLGDLDLTPPQAGLLWQIANGEPRSQQAHARRLGMQPSRFVGFVDELEARGLVVRQRGELDRRAYVLVLTAKGRSMLDQLREVADAHEQEICAGLDAEERETLRRLLGRLAEHQGMHPDVHPSYRRL
jgi:DNA-binding MarR family transcriptional regulator